MNVQQLINELSLIPDKNKKVMIQHLLYLRKENLIVMEESAIRGVFMTEGEGVHLNVDLIEAKSI
ncbi:hypothetical protein [Shouchella patagoniensis]|uniref:hypothetical protein n=1 Tax=Shouchella patagoniensis TaxID=228576 RepID=UPI00099564CE|nr:hypothetical protein [Shouchella patagoniensis]